MDFYTLPELSAEDRSYGNHNVIYHRMAPSIDVSLEAVMENRSYMVITDNGERYCLTGNSEIYEDGCPYVLLMDRAPSKQRLLNGDVKSRRWLKHPMIGEYTPDVIVDSWTNQFFYKEEQDGMPGLRKPQLGALHAILGHIISPAESAIVVLPTGTGKTETMLSTLIAFKCQKLLVTVPSDALREQISNKFITLGVLKNPDFGLLGPSANHPIVGIIRGGFDDEKKLKEFISKCNVVVTTMQKIDSSTENQKNVFVNEFSNIFVDEAHHIKAKSWKKFADQFPRERLIQFTATPFRNDGEKLDGKIIFNYPLRKAQEDGYYHHIEFLPVRVYDDDKVDRKIASVAVARLRHDLENQYDHMLMARCETKERAEQVFEIYHDICPDLKPVVLYSGHPNHKENYKKVLSKEAKIVVCVNMLGEGFDLPELKIAAFHDIRKSLPVTLQFAGRFTRTSRDAHLGNASFIANIADVNVQQELDNLYEEDADWNVLLANANERHVDNEAEYKDLIDSFKHGVKLKIPVSSIFPKHSAVAYKCFVDVWHPERFFEGITSYDQLDYSSYDINEKHKILVAVTAKNKPVEGIRIKDICTLDWNYLILFWDTSKNILFINSSDNSSLYKEVAKAVCVKEGMEPQLIKGINIFRSFSGLKRTKLRNVGLKLYLGKDIRFRMHAGRDVENVLSNIERDSSEKAFVVGDGFENGERTSIGASYKGRIWSLAGDGDILSFRNWCLKQGEKLTDETIDGNAVVLDSLVPKTISALPPITPFFIDWDEGIWSSLETRYKFNILGIESFLYETTINLREERPIEGNSVFFCISNDSASVDFKMELFENNRNPQNTYPDYRIMQLTGGESTITVGTKEFLLSSYLESNLPTIYFCDGSFLCGNEYLKIKTPPALFNRERLIAWDWDGVDLNKESQGVAPDLEYTSIQFKVIDELKKEDYDIIYDDDNSGEIADVLAFKSIDGEVIMEMYHLKFAIGGITSDRITNLYEVCGQAQKSSNWKYKEPEELINHMLRREIKRKNGQECSRIQKGNHDTLLSLLKSAKNKLPMKYKIYVVQPGISKATATDEMLALLGVTESFLKDRTGIELNVITSK